MIVFQSIEGYFKSFHRSQSGYSLVNLGLSIVILSGLLLGGTLLSQRFIEFFSDATEEQILYNLAVQKANQIKSKGYWAWNLDSESPSFVDNEYDPSNQWKEDLQDYPDVRGFIQTRFLKEVNNNLELFSNVSFEDDLPRLFAEVVITMTNATGRSVEHRIVMVSEPSEEVLMGILLYLKQGLLMYYSAFNGFPDTGQLDYLVGPIIDEIPNDPYTDIWEKNTNREEKLDWTYSNNTELKLITLYANSHPEKVLTWNY